MLSTICHGGLPEIRDSRRSVAVKRRLLHLFPFPKHKNQTCSQRCRSRKTKPSHQVFHTPLLVQIAVAPLATQPGLDRTRPALGVSKRVALPREVSQLPTQLDTAPPTLLLKLTHSTTSSQVRKLILVATGPVLKMSCGTPSLRQMQSGD